MGGEGSMAAANNSLKNNRKLLTKRKDKKALSGSYADVKMKIFPDSTPELLAEIKAQTIAENRAYKRKIVITTFVLIVIFSVFIYFVIL